MPADDPVITVLRGWVDKAENDLRAAGLIVKSGDERLGILLLFTRSSAVRSI